MKQTRKSLKLIDWPDVDRSRWLTACEKADWFDEQGRAANWSPASQHDAQYLYGYWLRYLTEKEPDLLLEDLGSRVTPARIQSFVSDLKTHVSPVTVVIYVDHWLMALRVLAPEQDWQHLTKLVRHLKQSVTPNSKRHRLVETARLYQLGLDLMGPVEGVSSYKNMHCAVRYRDGLMIALLAARPLRRRTFTLIRIDEHLQYDGHSYYLSFRDYEIKNKRPAEYSIPTELNPYLAEYLKTIRPLFPRADTHTGLWCSMAGQALSSSAIYSAICKRTKVAFGHPVNLHLFRDCAATSLATHAPESVLAGVEILGHTDTRALYTHYIHAQTQQAGKAYQAHLADRRQRLAPPVNHRRGKK